jgi:hypothetical protein
METHATSCNPHLYIDILETYMDLGLLQDVDTTIARDNNNGVVT